MNKLTLNLPFGTTMDYCDDPAFRARATVICPERGTLWEEFKSIGLILKAARKFPALLLDSSSGRIHPDLTAAILIRLIPAKKRPAIVFMGDMWQKDPGVAGWVQKMMLKLADPVIQRYAMLSTDEMPLFSAAWGIHKDKLRFTPYFYTFTDEDLSSPPPPFENFIFSGGNTHRDYAPLVEAARALPEFRFIIATHLLKDVNLPPNMTAGPVPRDEFIRMMRACSAVIVPMRQGLIRSAGHQTYLNAMLLEKPTIVNKILGVNDHIINGETALVVDGSIQGFVDSIRYVFDPVNQTAVRQMSANARKAVLKNFSFSNHVQILLHIIDEAIHDNSGGRTS
jgi:hypothetical protein